MCSITKIKSTLKKHPNAYIYYYDSSSWMIYADKRACDKDPDGEDFILEGCDLSNGYCGNLTQALAEMLGFKVDSI